MEERQETAGQVVIAPLLEKQLEDESSSKSSLEQRGVAVISTSGVLVSLLFGLSAIVTANKDFALPEASRVLLVVALVLFVLAAVGGIVSNSPRPYPQVQTSEFERFVSEQIWYACPEQTNRQIAEAQVCILKGSRERNKSKARALYVAIITQILAVAVLATAIAIILIETS
jgi:hypothetical protein